MFINKSFTTPNGAATTYHEVLGLEVFQDGRCVATVASKLYEESLSVSWRDTYPISPVVFDGSDMLAAATNYLVSPDGTFADGIIDDPSANALEKAKIKRWTYIKEMRNKASSSGVDTTHGRFDSDLVSLQMINGAVTAALVSQTLNTAFSKDWTLADNSSVNLDAQEMIEVGIAVVTHIDHAHQISRTLRVAIQEAATVEEVDAIIWPT